MVSIPNLYTTWTPPVLCVFNLTYHVSFLQNKSEYNKIKTIQTCLSQQECLNEKISDLHGVNHRLKPVVVTCCFIVLLQQKTHSCRAMNQRQHWEENEASPSLNRQQVAQWYLCLGPPLRHQPPE